MDQHLISLAVAILLVSVGLSTMVAALTPEKIEAALQPELGGADKPNPDGIIRPSSICTAHGDVHYKTLDHKKFSFNTAITKLGVMVLKWNGNEWWVVTVQENIGQTTRIKEVYTKCSGEYFKAALFRDSTQFWRRVGGAWVEIPNGGPDQVFAGGSVTVGYWPSGGFEVQCHGVPMNVRVYLGHALEIELDGKYHDLNLGVRGICGDFNGAPGNDATNLHTATPKWKPLVVTKPV